MKRFLFLIPVILLAGCAHGYRFSNAEPINEAGDNKPSPVPKKNSFDYVEYSVSTSLRYPVLISTRAACRAART